ncbi:MAG: M1 family aminopeptidase [Planctomycetota bacterium]
MALKQVLVPALLALVLGGGALAQEALHHEIHVKIFPEEGRLEGDCTVLVTSPKTEGKAVTFDMPDASLEAVEIDGIASEAFTDQDLGEVSKAYDIRQLTVPLPAAPGKETLSVRIRYHDEDFYATAVSPEDQKPFSLGQIDAEAGSFSSHIAYYPYVRHAGKSGDIHITVPEEQLAVSSGTLVEILRPEPGWVTYHWRSDRGSGILPYPFACHTYNLLRDIASDGKTPLEIYYLQEDETFAREKLPLLQEIFAFYLGTFGSYPFPKLAVVETNLLEGSIGLAAQSVVMLSQKVWFAASLDPGNTSLANRPLLVLADETAHQWNAYKVATPNFLAEGISRYTDSLYMAHRASRKKGATAKDGEAVLATHMKLTRDSYFALIKGAPDLAISSPLVTPALYFIKGALALDMLRSRLGEETFLAGMRHYFTENENKVTDLKGFSESFERVASQPLWWHFDQWYNRNGHPLLRWTWTAVPAAARPTYTVSLTLEQKQDGLPYRLLVPVEVRDATGAVERATVDLTETIQKIDFNVSLTPSEVVIDPEGRLPVELTKVP